MSAMRLLPGVHPDELVARAKAEHRPVARVCLFSGGNDSSVLAHRCREHYDSLAFIDTGTALPGVREFVEASAERLGKPLIILESGDAYRRLVLGIKENPPPGWRPYGFPGPAGHNRAYNALKEPQLRALRARLQHGHKRGSRVLMLTGLRRGESQRRSKRLSVTSHGAIRFVNPLIDCEHEAELAALCEGNVSVCEDTGAVARDGVCPDHEPARPRYGPPPLAMLAPARRTLPGRPGRRRYWVSLNRQDSAVG